MIRTFVRNGLRALVGLLLAVPFADAACVTQQAGELTAILSWTNQDAVTTDKINVLRSTSSGTETLLTTIPYGTTYTDTVPKPTATTTYYYELQAVGPGGAGPISQESCKTFFVGPPSPINITVQ